MAKTFPECCDEVAKKYNLGSWSKAYYDRTWVADYQLEAAELYRDEGIKEAIKLAREVAGIDKIEEEPIFQYTEQEILEKLKV